VTFTAPGKSEPETVFYPIEQSQDGSMRRHDLLSTIWDMNDMVVAMTILFKSFNEMDVSEWLSQMPGEAAKWHLTSNYKVIQEYNGEITGFYLSNIIWFFRKYFLGQGSTGSHLVVTGVPGQKLLGYSHPLDFLKSIKEAVRGETIDPVTGAKIPAQPRGAARAVKAGILHTREARIDDTTYHRLKQICSERLTFHLGTTHQEISGIYNENTVKNEKFAELSEIIGKYNRLKSKSPKKIDCRKNDSEEKCDNHNPLCVYDPIKGRCDNNKKVITHLLADQEAVRADGTLLFTDYTKPAQTHARVMGLSTGVSTDWKHVHG